LKELGKDVELVVLALGIVCWVSDLGRFKLAYGFAVAVFFVDLVTSVAHHRGAVLHVAALQTSTPLYILVLSIPFVGHRRVLPLVGFAGVLLVVSKTREAWLGALLVVILIVANKQLRATFGRVVTAVLVASVGFLVVLVSAVPGLRVRVDRVFSGSDQSVHDRFAMAHAAFLEFQHHLVSGVGPGEFKPWLLLHPPPFQFLVGLPALARDPHDAFAKFAAELGAPGLILFLCWVAAVIGIVAVYASDGLRVADLRPYMAGAVLFTVVYVLMLLTSEWGAITRFELPLGAALLMSLGRVVPATRVKSDLGVVG
jgi:O-antigen ligase